MQPKRLSNGAEHSAVALGPALNLFSQPIRASKQNFQNHLEYPLTLLADIKAVVLVSQPGLERLLVESHCHSMEWGLTKGSKMIMEPMPG